MYDSIPILIKNSGLKFTDSLDVFLSFLGLLLGVVVITYLGFSVALEIRRVMHAKRLINSIFGDLVFVQIRYWTGRPDRELRPSIEIIISLDKKSPGLKCSAVRSNHVPNKLLILIRWISSFFEEQTIFETSIGPFTVLLQGDESMVGGFNDLSESVTSRLVEIFDLGFRRIEIQDRTILIYAFGRDLPNGLIAANIRSLRPDLIALISELNRTAT